MDEQQRKASIVTLIKEVKDNAVDYAGREFITFLWIDKETLSKQFATQPPRFYRYGQDITNQTLNGTKTISVAEILLFPLEYILNRLANDFGIDLMVK